MLYAKPTFHCCSKTNECRRGFQAFPYSEILFTQLFSKSTKTCGCWRSLVRSSTQAVSMSVRSLAPEIPFGDGLWSLPVQAVWRWGAE